MRRLILTVVLLSSIGCMAEERAQLFGGYQFTSAALGGTRVSLAKGWDADLEYKAGGGLGLVIDASGTNKEGSKIHTIMVGPRFSMNWRKLTPFTEAMYGAAILSSHSSNFVKVSLAFGGGLDWKIRQRLYVRMFKADYNFVKVDRFEPLPGTDGFVTHMNNFRLATGLAVKF